MLKRGYTESEAATTPRQLALILVVGALTVCALNALAGRYLERHGTNLAYLHIAHKWRVLGELKRPVDWLLLGDSALAQGVDPALIEAARGKRAVNLGTIGNFGLTDDLWMLEEYIARFGAPEAVALVHGYDQWPRQLDRRLFGRIPRHWIFGGRFARREGLGLGARARFLVDRFVPLHTERESLRRAVELGYWRATSSLTQFDARLARRFVSGEWRFFPSVPVQRADGYVEMCGALPEYVRRQAAGILRGLRDEPAARAISEENERAFGEIVALAERHRFTLHIMSSPLVDEVMRAPAVAERWSAVRARLRELAATSGRVHLVDEVAGFVVGQMQGVDHIDCEVVPSYTRWLAQRLAEAP
jgi:hypothetical protein